MGEPQRKFVVDPADPRAPSQEAWDRMTEAERAEVLDSLPSEFPVSEAAPPPEGDTHFDAVVRARDVLRGFFGRSGRRVWIANNLPIYYPEERMFSPDVIAVVDVDVRSRDHWTVSDEGKGLDMAIEILWSGRRKKDLTDNVERYARLGIPEYFIFDRNQQTRASASGERHNNPRNHTRHPATLPASGNRKPTSEPCVSDRRAPNESARGCATCPARPPRPQPPAAHVPWKPNGT